MQRSTDQERLRYEEEEKYKKLQRTEKEIAAKQQLLSNTETAIAAETEEDEHATNQNTKLPIPEQKDSSSGPHLPHRSLSSQLYDPDTDLDNELESTQPTTTGADSETDVDGNENIEQVPCECCHHTIPSDKYGHLDVHYPCSETCGNLWYNTHISFSVMCSFFAFFFNSVVVGIVHHQKNRFHLRRANLGHHHHHRRSHCTHVVVFPVNDKVFFHFKREL